ncbi:hypothetical protein K2173_010128 [Erythroxylum novogranatense]|uniref:HMG-Y-related protein A n=1 Tax=Erythroxylum novogranatense TaxID=1862640 RepID=A0AAV8TTJ9_9ROSI|nr:hypothetical protein K2173_010128 [Erythroxylum novogranatense]
MATTEISTNPLQPTAEPVVPQPQHEQQQTVTLPPYPEMIMAAIEALNDKDGSNKTAISRQIESTNSDLPAAHATLLSHHLNKMKQSGQLVMVKNNYVKPDPNAPPKRGRGRPPKPKVPLPAGTVLSPPRPRGRPPKSKDLLAPVGSPKKASSGGTGRPRGRPPKKAKTVGVTPPASGAPRGRGRPPKVKTTVAPVAG